MQVFHRTFWKRVLPGFLSFLLVITTAQVSIAAKSDPYLKKLEEADRLLFEGNLQMSERIRREAKPNFPGGSEVSAPKPIQSEEIDRLSPAAQVYWRNALEGIEQKLISKTLIPLQLLTENYPDFLDGHLKLAEVCEAEPKPCREQAKEGQPATALDALERASTLYPDQVKLLDAKLALLERMVARNDEKNAFFLRLLDASIAARQFALAYPEHPDAEKYATLADQYMKRYQKDLSTQITIYGTMGILMGNSQTAARLRQLAQGENAMGEYLLENHKKQHEMVDDPELNNYVTQVGQKLATFAGRKDLNYEFLIAADPSLNAITFPGGKVVINAGLLKAARTEAELAGILSHEISHAALSHYYLKQTELLFMNAFSRILPLGELFRDISTIDVKHQNEKDADILGTRLLAKSGYAADGLWSHLKALDEAIGIPWTESHPASASRVRNLERLIRRNGYSRYAYEGVEKQRKAQNRLETVLAGRSLEPSSSDTEGDAFVDRRSVGNSEIKLPEKPTPRREQAPARRSNQRTVGKVELGVNQEREGINITLTSAYVSNSGAYIVDVEIANQSDRPFGFVPVFAEVTDEDGKRVSARYNFESTGANGVMVKPGETLTGKVNIPTRRWSESGKQGITLVIKEGTVGGRVFRIPL